MEKISVKILFISLCAMFVVGLYAFSPKPVEAYTPPCSGGSICDDVRDTGGSKVDGFVKNGINTALFVAGLLAVIMIIFSGIRFMTAHGDPSQVKTARMTLTYAVVGLIVTMLAYSIVNWVVGRL